MLRAQTPPVGLSSWLPGSLWSVLEEFRPCFTAPTFETLVMLVAGLISGPVGRTVCGMLQGAGLAGRWHHGRAHRFLPRRCGAAMRSGLVVFGLVMGWLIPAGAPVLVVMDDTMFRRSGPKVHAAHWRYDGSMKVANGGKKVSRGGPLGKACPVDPGPQQDGFPAARRRAHHRHPRRAPEPLEQCRPGDHPAAAMPGRGVRGPGVAHAVILARRRAGAVPVGAMAQAVGAVAGEVGVERSTMSAVAQRDASWMVSRSQRCAGSASSRACQYIWTSGSGSGAGTGNQRSPRAVPCCSAKRCGTRPM